MSGVSQAVFMNQRSFGSPPPGGIGSAYGGGFFAGQISTAGNGVATHNLVIGPLSSAQTTAQWKTTNTFSGGASSFINGPTNSANLNNASHPAAQFCEGLTIGGFTDWYMPARNELDVCYYNLKPTTEGNNTASGVNTNAVPIRNSNYTSETPVQTSAAAFVTGGAEAFAAGYYWSSTESSAPFAWAQFFGDGGLNDARYKESSYKVRAVRRVPV